jgi:hypothetical protein
MSNRVTTMSRRRVFDDAQRRFVECDVATRQQALRSIWTDRNDGTIDTGLNPLR